LLKEFVSTVYALVVAAKWDELRQYLALVRDLYNQPNVILVAARPRDKEV